MVYGSDLVLSSALINAFLLIKKGMPAALEIHSAFEKFI